MKIALGFIASLVMTLLSCGAGVQEITFKRAQPLGQKSTYSMKNTVRSQPSPELAPIELLADATIETEVTSAQPNGNWTLTTRYTSIDLKIDGKSQPDQAAPLAGKSFSVVMDREGKVLDVTGSDAPMAGLDLKQLASQMNPEAMLPASRVRIGETWPINTSSDIEMAGGAMHQIIKGTGTLRSANAGQAIVDFDLDFALSMAGAPGMNLNGSGKGKSSMTYDLDKARAISNKSDSTIEMTAEFKSGSQTQQTRSKVSISYQIDLIDK